MLTGEYAHNHNVKGNKRLVGGFEKFREEGNEEGSIAARLQENGYRTALIGKYLNGYGQGDQTYVPPGWDEWYAKLGRYEYYDYELNENGEVASYGSETGDYLTDVLSEKVPDFVRRAAADDAPFFAYVAPTAPHSPATPAERHRGTLSDGAPRSPAYNEEDVSDKPGWVRDLTPVTGQEGSQIDDLYRERLEATLAVDEMVGSLVEELEAAGELENTFRQRLVRGRASRNFRKKPRLRGIYRGASLCQGTGRSRRVAEGRTRPQHGLRPDLCGVRGRLVSGRWALPGAALARRGIPFVALGRTAGEVARGRGRG